MNDIRKKRRYINYLTCVFLLVYGMKALDGGCLTYLSEELMTSLRCTTAQYSSLSSLYYLTYSLSCMLVGMLTSRMARRKILLAPMTLATGVISLATTQVNSFTGLALCRFLTGFFQGGSFSLMLSILSKNLVVNDYGRRNGIINMGSSVISTLAGPVLFSYMALHYAWNTAYYLTGPVLIALSLVICFTVDEVKVEVQKKAADRGAWQQNVRECIHSHVFLMCLGIGVLETLSNLCVGVFAPLYYTDVMGYDTLTKAAFLSAKGLCTLPLMLIVPALADRFSVRKVMTVTFSLAFLAPFVTAVLPGTAFSAVVLAALGAVGGATVSLFTYMIPRNALPERLHGMANGVILGVSCLIGGTIAPVVLGLLVEIGWPIPSVLGICALTYLFCVVLSVFLKVRPNDASQDARQAAA